MPAISIMIKPASGRCNLRCKYCFYHDLTKNREIADYGIMDIDTAKRIIDSAVDFAKGDNIYFTFQGGEPLLAGKEYFLRFFEHAKQKNKDGNIFYCLQTNGTLLDKEWIKIFKDNSVFIGLSSDGDEEGNRFRLDANGKSAFDRISKAATMLKEGEIDFNILTVVTGYTAENIQRIYRYFTSQGYKYLQFIPCLRPIGDKSESELYMTVPQYENFLSQLFSLYVKDYMDGNYTSVRYFDNMVRMYLGQRAEQCGMEGHCSRQLVAESNGNVYTCDFYCTDEWLLGNINTSDLAYLASCEKAKKFVFESLQINPECAKCGYFNLCRGGGCKRQKSDRDYCRAYKSFFSKNMRLFEIFSKH